MKEVKIARMPSEETPSFRVFLLGAGFSKPAGLPLASELLPSIEQVNRECFQVDGRSHLGEALEDYREYLDATEPKQDVDIEKFGAWLDWQHTLRMEGSETFSDLGSEARLQLQWAIGKSIHDATPSSLPGVYLDFASRLNTTDRIWTLNYDLLIERSLEEVGLPYRRFPNRYSEIGESYLTIDPDQPKEMVVSKLHGSIDWTNLLEDEWGRIQRPPAGVHSLPEGLRPVGDPLATIGVIPPDLLKICYSEPKHWHTCPVLLFPPSNAKPMSGSAVVPLWNGLGLYAYMLGGVNIIGCSLPEGDQYVKQLVYNVTLDYARNRLKQGVPWPQPRIKVISKPRGSEEIRELHRSYRFLDPTHSDFYFEGFSAESLELIFGNSL